MPLGYIPGTHPGIISDLSHRVFGSRKFSRIIEYRIIKKWLPNSAIQILDVGSGGGDVSIQLALMGHQVTALDFSYEALRDGVMQGIDGVEFVNGDATCLPFDKESFDVIVCNSALEHFPNDECAISEMFRVVRKGGAVIITTDSFPEKASGWLTWVPSAWRREEMKNCKDLLVPMQAYHQKTCFVVNYYRFEQLSKKITEQGLKIKDWHYYLNGLFSKGIYELHILVKWLDFYNKTSRRLFPLFYPFTFFGRRKPLGHGLAIKAVKPLDHID
jgi:ubiquinone/menaquinone biosynthesis C-methylase UbiE